MGLDGPSREVKVEPVKLPLPAPEKAPAKEPAVPEREKVAA